MIAAPIRCGVEVGKVQRNIGPPGFGVETSDGVIEANNVVRHRAVPAPDHPGPRP
jgi:putative flavoprotein involved in K+ transport